MAAEADRLDDLLGTLAQSGARALPLHGSQVEVLESPDQFFQLLLAGLATTQQHITIASLYFGTGGGREQEFADALAAAAHDTAARPELQVRLLLDALRSTRPTKGADAAEPPNGVQDSSGSGGVGGGGGSPASERSGGGSAAPPLTSTAEMLAVRLLEGQLQPGGAGQLEPRVAVSLFHTPALRGLLKRVLPPRVSEIIGVQHMKLYLFDDTVILSGANISSTYLSTRQDRYIVIRSAPQLASLLRRVVDTVSRFSYQLHPLLPPASQAADADGQATAADGDSGAAASGSLGSGGAGSRPRRRDVLLQLLEEQRLPWQQPAGELDGAAARSWAQSLAALLGQQQGGSGNPQPSEGHEQAAGSAGMLSTQQAQQQAQQAQHEHHLKRHRSQRQQRYRLEACPAGVDPVRQAGLFSWRLHRELLPLFVAGLDEEQLQWQPEGQQQSGRQQNGCVEQQLGAAPAAAGGRAAVSDSSPAVQQPGQLTGAAPDTWLVPVVQAGFAGLRQEEQLTLATLAWAAQLPQGQLPWAGMAGSSGGGSDGSARISGSGIGWGAAMGGWRGGSSSASSALVQLASPYLNLARPLERFLSRRAGSLDLELVTAAPEANGFFGSKGVSGLIPLAYSLIEQRTWRRLTRQQRRLAWRTAWEQPRDRGSSGSAWGPLGAGLGAAPGEPAGGEAAGAEAAAAWPAGMGAAGALGPGSGRRLFEFCRPGWEYHAKGIWISLPAAASAGGGGSNSGGGSSASGSGVSASPASAPSPGSDASTISGGSASRWAAPAVTSVGSSNYGWRSLRRDLELNFLLVTRNPQLQQALGREVERLKQHCQEVLGDAHFRAPGRRATAAARLAVRLLRGFL